MFRIAKIWLGILVFSSSFSQERETNFSLVYPEFIPVNSTFDISLTITNSYPEADKFELLLIPENKLSINKVEYKSIYESKILNADLIYSEEYLTDLYSLQVDLSDSLRSEGIIFQLLLNIKAELVTSSKIKFKGSFRNNEEVTAVLSPADFTYNDFITAELEFYNPQKISDKAITFSENGFLLLDIANEFDNNLLLDFWIKINEPSVKFLKIFDRDFKEPAVTLSTNNFQMLYVSSELFSQNILKPFFVGKKSWYHITVASDEKKGTIKFYCNGNLVAENQLPPLFEESELKFEFGNTEKEKSFIIDQLRVIDFTSSETVSFNNRHSVNFNSDSSSIAALYKMDSPGEFGTETQNVKLDYSNVVYVRSGAPLFVRSPELNILPLGNLYELEWTGGDYKHAQYYILEKSSGSSFKQIHTVQADNTEAKSYSFFDVPDENSEIVYYRIKQLNYDGSVIYSSQVKVGQGVSEPFTIGQNYPNPFNPKTSIEVDLLQDSEIEITIYSLDGREITKIFKGYLSQGPHKFDFDGEGLPSGIYLYKIASPGFTKTKKMILAK